MNKLKIFLTQFVKNELSPAVLREVGFKSLENGFILLIPCILFWKFRTVDFENVILNGIFEVIFHSAVIASAACLAFGFLLLLHSCQVWLKQQLGRKTESKVKPIAKQTEVDPLWLISHAERVGSFQSDKKNAENNPR